MNNLLTVNQLSDALNFNVKTIRNWCDDGVFPTARKVPNKPRGQWRVLSDDIALLSMIDGHADNVAMLADQQKQIADLKLENERLIAEANQRHSEYVQLHTNFNKLIAEANQLDTEIFNMKTTIDDLQRYKDHYDQQRQKRQRRAA